MNQKLRADADRIIQASIAAVMPGAAVEKALQESQEFRDFVPGDGKVVLVAAGKAAWEMARAALSRNIRIDEGIVITKYGHVKGTLPGVSCYEAGHPVPDENGFAATEKALQLVSGLGERDTVLFLLSGGGSALFESPLIPGEELADLTQQLLACGADIVEMNTVRKRLSRVKGGRFAAAAAPARVFSIVLSDILGDPLDMIASGPAYPDRSTCEEAMAIARRYGLRLSDAAWQCLGRETEKELENVETHITGSVRELCRAAGQAAEALGYQTVYLTDALCCEAKDAGSFLASIAKSYARIGADAVRPGSEEAGAEPTDNEKADVVRPGSGRKRAFIAGGETVVHLTGKGKGGRNQELALSAAIGLAGIPGAAVFSIGSDGTDGPTDAAGGYVDGDTAAELDIRTALSEHCSYEALRQSGGLIITGPTGTNVNDVAVVLVEG